MKTNNPKKESFDAIQTMRKIRDAVSKEIKDMTLEQEQAFLDKLLADSSSK